MKDFLLERILKKLLREKTNTLKKNTTEKIVLSNKSQKLSREVKIKKDRGIYSTSSEAEELEAEKFVSNIKKDGKYKKRIGSVPRVSKKKNF